MTHPLLLTIIVVALVGIMGFIIGLVVYTLLRNNTLGKLRFVFAGIFVFLGAVLVVMSYIMLVSASR